MQNPAALNTAPTSMYVNEEITARESLLQLSKQQRVATMKIWNAGVKRTVAGALFVCVGLM